MSGKRSASHAGSWYSGSGQKLSSELDNWLANANATHTPAKAVIAPHAGYAYCGACSAWAYKQIDPSNIKRVFILGPSHHVYLSGCAVTSCESYETPLGDLPIDREICSELVKTGHFQKMNKSVDEDEHSIEMHLPYVAKVFENYQGRFKIVPVLVGSLKADKEQSYGRIFSKYLKDPQNLFIISSDFCHWGSRFSYTYHDKSYGKIYQSIEAVDKMGMDLIEQVDPRGFHSYLKEFGNTICGRHPIAVLLHAVDTLASESGNGKMSLQILAISQSNKCKTDSDSSVSYASASLVFS
ncbi:LOW QUALITY PROTEIN: protein MEMO1-like [Amphiura filiformis]|uniref:LOW QUALITY PROTEIN: protein MEMO1-like n=1 Tax=Amphiura filiformis TaxID=82378 RepID=UPI003B225AD1